MLPPLDTAGFTEADKYIGYQGIRQGDLAIHAMDGFAGAIGVADSSGKCSPVVSVCQPKAGSEPQYYAHVLRHVAKSGYLTAIAKGIRERSTDFRWSDARDIFVPMPPKQEQRDIVAFLDRETAKIDDLIAKQEQLIALLREDRTATITHAVTKGLASDVPMMESGVSWIGQMPEHWSVPQLGMLALIGNGSTPSRDEPRYWSGGTVPWLNSSHVNREQITDADQFITDAALMECHLPMVKPGSVLVGLTGQGKTRGMAALLTIRSTINQHLAYISPIDDQLDTRFLQRVLTSAYGLLRELSDENGSTKGGLTCSALRKVRVPLPPVVEQISIVDHLDSRCAALDALFAKAGQVVSTLQEYRSALITDAVTGKIDVRGAA